MSLVTLTIDEVEFKSYASVEECDKALMIDPVRNPAWCNLSPVDKLKHLAAATRRLDMLNWLGKRAEDDQETEWPREDMVYPNGDDIPNNVIPDDLELATCLLAGSVAQNAANANVVAASAPIRRVRAGAAEVEFSERQTGRNRHQAANQVADPAVHALIRKWLSGAAGAAVGGGVVSGSSDESCFRDMNPYGHTTRR